MLSHMFWVTVLQVRFMVTFKFIYNNIILHLHSLTFDMLLHIFLSLEFFPLLTTSHPVIEDADNLACTTTVIVHGIMCDSLHSQCFI